MMEKIESRKVNHLRALLTLTKYSLLANVRNTATVFFGVLFPLAFIMVFGFLGDRSPKFEVAIAENSLKEGSLYEQVVETEVLEIVSESESDSYLDDLKTGRISAIITIAKIDSADDVPAGKEKYNLELLTSDADPEGAEAVSSVVTGIVLNYNINRLDFGELLGTETQRQNADLPGDFEDLAKLQTVTLQEEKLTGRKFKYIDFVLPGQLSFAILSTGVFGLAFTFLNLRKTLVIKRIFATPTPRWAIILSEVLSRSIIALIQSTIIILTGKFMFDYTLANGFLTFANLLFIAAIGLLMSFGIGLLISALAEEENTIPPLANLITLPQFLLAGTFFPIEILPEWLQSVAKIMPLYYLNDAMRVISFEGKYVTDVLPQIAAIGLWCIVIYALVLKLFKWE